MKPYFLRKVRILNAAHTALLIKAKPRGFANVRDAVNDPELGAWLWRLLSEEIVPTLEGRVDQRKPVVERCAVSKRGKSPGDQGGWATRRLTSALRAGTSGARGTASLAPR